MQPDPPLVDGSYDDALDVAIDDLLADCSELADRLTESVAVLREVVEERRAWTHAWRDGDATDGAGPDGDR